jgi:ABC-2 type transport system permease protein
VTATLALVRAELRNALSYRLNLAFSLVGLLASIVPVYFVANALQPTMADAVAGEGGQYFAFLVCGIIGLSFLNAAVGTLPGAVGGGLRTGTLEAMLATPIRPAVWIAGMNGYAFIWVAVRGLLVLGAATLLGAGILWDRVALAVPIVVIIALAHLPFGMMAAAAILAFRTAGPLPQAVIVVSGLLGGVYYPTHVIPSWLGHVPSAVPITYGLRALRRTLLEDAPAAAVLPDVALLAWLGSVLMLVAAAALRLALTYARRAGTLAQY